MSVDATLTVNFQANDIRTVGLNTGANIGVSNNISHRFQDGTGALAVKKLFQLNGVLASGTYTLNLFTGSVDSYGTPLVLAAVKGLQVQNTGNANLVLGAAATNPWNTFLNATGTLTLPPGAMFQTSTPDATGWAVGTSTNVNLLFTGTGTQPFTLVLTGT
jgi:hypothetical protein